MLERRSFIVHRFSFLVAVAFATSAIACGSNVVVEHGNSGGAGAGNGGNAGSAGGPTTPTAGAAGGTSTCSAPDLVEDLDICPFDVPFGCGDGTLCDAVENQWRTKCNEAGCECIFNASVVCTCAFDESPCAGLSPEDCCAALNSVGCCPYPWVNHPGCKGTGASCQLNAECCNYLCFGGTCDP